MEKDFEQSFHSTTAIGIYTIGYEKTRSMNWLAYYDRYYENINFYDLMASVLPCLHEISER